MFYSKQIKYKKKKDNNYYYELLDRVCAMPKSIESSTGIDLGQHQHDHHHHQQQQHHHHNHLQAINDSSSLDRAAAVTSGGGGAGGNALGKKYRHQNYSKNIYIGTKNAEKWEFTRTKLAFKNDVEFVSYLLTLADTNYR